MTIEEFGRKAKEKYPQYKEIDDVELANKIIEKYPVYKDRIDGLEGAETTTPTTPTAEPKEDLTFGQKVGEFGVGAGKGALSTLKGSSSLGEKIITGIGRALTPKKWEESLGFAKKEQTSAEELIPEEMTEATNKYQKAGKFVEQVAEFAVPATKVSKLTKGMSLLPKLGTRAATSAGIAAAQSGEVGKESAIAGGMELALPVVGKVIAKPVLGVIKRLFQGVGSGLSGASVDSLTAIARNPSASQLASKQVAKEGQESILRKNADSILQGVSKIRQTARATYGKVVESLKKTDIKPAKVYDNLTKSLQKNDIALRQLSGRKGSGLVDFSSSEIFDQKIRNKARIIISEINDMIEPDGKKIRQLMDKIESQKFKSALDPDRQAFNNLMKDLSNGLKTALNESTDKLKNVNQMYTEKLGLTDAIERIFGKVKFKNRKELEQISEKLNTLFNKGDLSQQTIGEFFTEIGTSPSAFRASEATRQIYSKSLGANAQGLSPSELIRGITTAVITPKTIKDIAVATGIAEKIIMEIVSRTSPTARATIIKALINDNQ